MFLIIHICLVFNNLTSGLLEFYSLFFNILDLSLAQQVQNVECSVLSKKCNTHTMQFFLVIKLYDY